MWQNLYKNHIKHGKDLQKSFKKTSKCKNVKIFQREHATVTHKKRQILFHKFLGEYTLFLPPPPFFEGGE